MSVVYDWLKIVFLLIALIAAIVILVLNVLNIERIKVYKKNKKKDITNSIVMFLSTMGLIGLMLIFTLLLDRFFLSFIPDTYGHYEDITGTFTSYRLELSSILAIILSFLLVNRAFRKT